MESFTTKVESLEQSRIMDIALEMQKQGHKRLSEELLEEVLPIPLPESASNEDLTTLVPEKLFLPYLV